MAARNYQILEFNGLETAKETKLRPSFQGNNGYDEATEKQ